MRIGKKNFLFILLFVILGSQSLIHAQPRLVPLDYRAAGGLLEKILEKKLVRYEFKGDGTALTITRLNRFGMDWDHSEFTLDCAFRVRYNKGFINFVQDGEVSISGNGLMSVTEQRLGVKLLRVNYLKLEGSNPLVDSSVRMVLDKSLAGREFWQGMAPSVSEMLTKDNLNILILLTLNRILPQTAADENATVTLNRVQSLAFAGEPGMMQGNIDLNGTYQKIFKFSFSGQAGLEVKVMVEPYGLAGTITIERVNDLQLDHSPALLNGIVRRMVSGKLKGKTVEFSWE